VEYSRDSSQDLDVFWKDQAQNIPKPIKCPRAMGLENLGGALSDAVDLVCVAPEGFKGLLIKVSHRSFSSARPARG
jgi:hypothetical protein